MGRILQLHICGGTDYFSQIKQLFSDSAGVQCRHFPSLPELLLADTVPTAWFFESSRLSLTEHALFEKIRIKIQASHSIGLLVTKSIEEVFYWRQMDFKPLHLLYGAFTGQQILERIHSIYEERVSLNLPKVLLFTDPESNHVLLAKRLSDGGLRVRLIQAHETAILPEILLTEGCSALIWNLSVDLPDAESLYAIIRKEKAFSGLHIYFTSNMLVPPDAWVQKLQKNRKKVRESKDINGISEAVFADLNAEGRADLARDRRCGIVDQKSFFDFLHKNQINRYLEFMLPEIKQVHAQWGEVLAHTLENEIFFYVKNHVRLSDLIGRGGQATVLLSCQHSDEAILKKIADRVHAGFVRDVLGALGIEGVVCHVRICSLDAAATKLPAKVTGLSK